MIIGWLNCMILGHWEGKLIDPMRPIFQLEPHLVPEISLPRNTTKLRLLLFGTKIIFDFDALSLGCYF